VTTYYLGDNAFAFVYGNSPDRVAASSKLPTKRGDVVVVGNWYSNSDGGVIDYKYSEQYAVGVSKTASGGSHIARVQVTPAAGSIAFNFSWTGYSAYVEARTYQGAHAPGLASILNSSWVPLNSPTNQSKWDSHGSIPTGQGWWAPTSVTGVDMLFKVTDKVANGASGHLLCRHVTFTSTQPQLHINGKPRAYLYDGSAWHQISNSVPPALASSVLVADGVPARTPQKSVNGAVSPVGKEARIWDGTSWRVVVQ
jgi:hypothetical protein